MCVCYIIGVNRRGRDLKQWAAAINLPLGQAWFLLSILFDITACTILQENFANWNDRHHIPFLPSHEMEVTFEHNCLLCLSSLRPSWDVTTDIYIFNILNSVFFLNLFVLFIYLFYIFIFYIYSLFLFIYLVFSAVRRPLSVSIFYRHPCQTRLLFKYSISIVRNVCPREFRFQNTVNFRYLEPSREIEKRSSYREFQLSGTRSK